MSEEQGKFTKNILDEGDNSDSNIIVPEDEEIDERFRTLDEVSCHFEEEKLLGVNTYKSVQMTAEQAKQGKTSPKKGRTVI